MKFTAYLKSVAALLLMSLILFTTTACSIEQGDGKGESDSDFVESTVTPPATENPESETSNSPETPSDGPSQKPSDDVNGYFAENRIEIVAPNKLKSPDMAISGDGYDIFQMYEGTTWGYRYGCTYLYNDDGSIDLYLASPGANGEWDWISYRHSSDGGSTWTPEKMVLNPTQGSMDSFSNCDPGVVYFDGYYYLGYTSTLNSVGACNNLFVARSRNPDGPFEKWNGTGWGGEHPQPIVYYTTEYSKFGIGEPSFVELNGTLYIYYTNICPSGDYTMVATADATNENWPATMQFHGVAVEKATDSLDIKYVEEWGKFVGIGTGDRMKADSWIGVFESNDGIHFEMVDVVRKGTYSHLHNSGISSRRNGHIRVSEDANKLCVIYAYGSGWGQWNTRVQPITLSLSDRANYKARMAAEKKVENLTDPANRTPIVPEGERNYIMVRTQYDVYEYGVKDGSFSLAPYVYDECFQRIPLTLPDANLSFKVYDESVITVEGATATIRGVGSTVAEIRYGKELVNLFYVNILDEKKTVEGNPIVSFEPVFDSYTVYVGEKDTYCPQIRGRLRYSDGSFEELYVDNSSKALTFTGYDESIISVSGKGILTAKASGKTTVKITYANWSCDVEITVTADENLAYYKLGRIPALDYTNINFTKSDSAEVINGINNATLNYDSEGLRMVAKDVGTAPGMTDAFVRLDYSQSQTTLKAADYGYIEITYKVASQNSANATRAQLFVCAGNVTSETAECQVRFDLATDGEFHTVKINLSEHSWWTGDIHGIRFDFFDSSLGGDTMTVSSIKLTK